MLIENSKEFQEKHKSTTQNVITKRSLIRLKILEEKNDSAKRKYGKAVWQVDILGDCLKHRTPILYSQLKELFQECTNRAELPAKWKVFYMKLIHQNREKSVMMTTEV